MKTPPSLMQILSIFLSKVSTFSILQSSNIRLSYKVFWIQQNNNMELTPSSFQIAKNKRKLTHQNIKLHRQINEVKQQLQKMQEQEPPSDQNQSNPQFESTLKQIALQQKLIKKLKNQIQLYKLQRVKDNSEYIVREEDDLKIAKKEQERLKVEKNIYLNKKVDKNMFLQKDVPYQQYEHNFLEKLTEVVRHNREQTAKITEIEREIRKYHLVKRNKDASPEKSTSTLDQISIISTQIEEKIEAKKKLQAKWKPHFAELDEQFASLLHQLSLKKEEVCQIEKEQKSWETRVSAIRQAEAVLSDKQRLEQVTVSKKLKKQLEDYLRSEEEKKKKKVNHEQLMYQFMAQKVKDNDKGKDKQKDKDKKEGEASKSPVSTAPPLLPGQKKKEQKILQTQHNDKNITKKIERGSPKKTIKSNQTSNTELSISPKGEKSFKLPREESSVSSIVRKPLPNQEKGQERLWEISNSLQPLPKEITKPAQQKVSDPPNSGLLQLKEVAIVTENKDWNEQSKG